MAKQVKAPFDTVTEFETLEDKCLRVCKVILESGIAVRGGKIAPGGNNMLASNAAMHIFNDEDAMQRLNGYVSGPFFEFKKLVVAYQEDRLQDAAQAAIALKNFSNVKRIYAFDAKPLNWDINAAGAKMAGYVEPTGVAKDFVDAFGIGYKNPNLSRGSQIGDGSALTPR